MIRTLIFRLLTVLLIPYFVLRAIPRVVQRAGVRLWLNNIKFRRRRMDRTLLRLNRRERELEDLEDDLA